MSWVVSLARSGGTAGSQGGHETRRHRVRGPFPMGACLLLAGTLALAGCGSSSNSTVTINPQQPDPQQSEPELQTGGGSGEGEGDGGQGAGGGTPPIDTTTTEDGDGDTDSGDTTSTGDGDGDGQDGGSPGGGQGVSGGQTVTQQPQQPPQQPSNQQSPQTGGGQGGGGNPPDNPVVSRSVNLPNNPPPNNNPPPSTDFSTLDFSTLLENKTITATYTRRNGFVGEYVYKGVSGQFSSDVQLTFIFDGTNAKISGFLGDDIRLYKGSGSKSNNSNYLLFNGLLVDATVDTETGSFTVQDPKFGFYYDNRSNRLNRTDSGTGTIEATFFNDGSNDGLLSTIKGKVEVTGFRQKAAGTTNYESGDGNRLTGEFGSDLSQSTITRIKASEGNIDMLSYGIWASENSIDNRIVFLEQTTKFNPGRTASDYTSHTTNNNDIHYRREDGFKGAYVYEGETGELTGDVHLAVSFRSNEILADGNISTDLEIGGKDLLGITIKIGPINLNTGVGDIDIDEDGIYDPRPTTKIDFGRFDLDTFSGGVTKATVNYSGLRKVRMVLSPDGIQAQAGVPESYPSQIAGELEINKFKINASDGDNNTIVGVFVADKQ